MKHEVVDCFPPDIYSVRFSNYVHATQFNKNDKNDRNNARCLLRSVSWNETMKQNPFTQQKVKPSIA